MKTTGLKNFLKNINLTYIVLVIVVLSVLIIRLALPGMVKNYVNKQLNELPGYTGHVDDIDIHLLRGAYAIEGLLLRKRTDPPKYPFLKIGHIDLSVEWKAILKGRLVSEVIANEPAINILSTEDIKKEPSKESWDQTVKALMPITINKLQINKGRFAYLDFQKKPNVNLHIDDMQLTALNLANVQKTNDPLPSDVTLTGTTIGKGRLKAHMKVNVLKEIPDFNLGMELTNANLLALNSFLEANVKIDIERGSLDVFSNVKMMDGQINGYVKPFVKNLKVLNVKKDIKKKGGILRVVKEAVVGLFTNVVKNPKTKKIATIIPIEGNIKAPKTSGWAAFVGFLKNAFVRAFKESITNEAKVKQGN
jgi:hypothetical protein